MNTCLDLGSHHNCTRMNKIREKNKSKERVLVRKERLALLTLGSTTCPECLMPQPQVTKTKAKGQRVGWHGSCRQACVDF